MKQKEGERFSDHSTEKVEKKKTVLQNGRPGKHKKDNFIENVKLKK